jgi:2-C-methyl-D-erythritol 4-phosphate cytidylyltransferase
MKRIVIVPAGSKGVRSGFKKPKQFVKVKGKELIVYSLETFQNNKSVDSIIVSADRAYFRLLESIKKKYGIYKITGFVEGGKQRQDSVYNALSSVTADKNDLIIVHDAARPLLPAEVLTNAIKTAQMKGNAVVCIKGNNTLIRGRKYVKEYIPRDDVYYVQTPQIFRYGDLMKAMHRAYGDNFYGTDESMLIQRIGRKVNITGGSGINFKVTTKEDFKLFESLVQ